jgi:hypothetical protein
VNEMTGSKERAHDAACGGFRSNLGRVGCYHFDRLKNGGARKADGLAGYGGVPVAVVL